MDETYEDCWFTGADGLRLYYRDYAGPAETETAPLLCLPGLTRNSLDFHELAVRHRVRRRVLCPDFRGRGKSGRCDDPMDYAFTNTIEDIRHLLAVANAHKVVLVGTSFGGLITMAMGAALPAVIKAAVLNDVGPDIGEDGLQNIRDYLSSDLVLPDWDAAVVLMRQNFPRETMTDPKDWLRLAQGTFEERGDGKLRYSFDRNLIKLFDPGVERPDLWPLFKSLVNFPVLLIRGADSDVLKPETLVRMAEAHPGMEHFTLEGCGHPPTLTEPPVEKVLDDFLARH